MKKMKSILPRNRRRARLRSLLPPCFSQQSRLGLRFLLTNRPLSAPENAKPPANCELVLFDEQQKQKERIGLNGILERNSHVLRNNKQTDKQTDKQTTVLHVAWISKWVRRLFSAQLHPQHEVKEIPIGEGMPSLIMGLPNPEADRAWQ